MTYATLMVHVELGRSNAALLKLAGDLAERLQTGVVGMAAVQPVQLTYGDGFLAGEVVEQDRADIAGEIEAAEAEFRVALSGRARHLDWRAQVTFLPLAEALAREARRADLIVTGLGPPGVLFNTARRANVGDLAMQAGRPVLIAPEGVERLELGHAIIGWKETREARRALADAIPLLKLAARVSVVEIAARPDLPEAGARLADIVHWLNHHGVTAEAEASATHGEDAARLAAIADQKGADLIVAGAYGHSRLREWALGGVTQDLLMNARRCALVSH